MTDPRETAWSYFTSGFDPDNKTYDQTRELFFNTLATYDKSRQQERVMRTDGMVEKRRLPAWAKLIVETEPDGKKQQYVLLDCDVAYPDIMQRMGYGDGTVAGAQAEATVDRLEIARMCATEHIHDRVGQVTMRLRTVDVDRNWSLKKYEDSSGDEGRGAAKNFRDEFYGPLGMKLFKRDELVEIFGMVHFGCAVGWGDYGGEPFVPDNEDGGAVEEG